MSPVPRVPSSDVVETFKSESETETYLAETETKPSETETCRIRDRDLVQNMTEWTGNWPCLNWELFLS